MDYGRRPHLPIIGALPPLQKTPIFTLDDTASFTAWTLYNTQQANFGTCNAVARAYSLEQQNAGRAQAGLCHASCCRRYCFDPGTQFPGN